MVHEYRSQRPCENYCALLPLHAISTIGGTGVITITTVDGLSSVSTHNYRSDQILVITRNILPELNRAIVEPQPTLPQLLCSQIARSFPRLVLALQPPPDSHIWLHMYVRPCFSSQMRRRSAKAPDLRQKRRHRAALFYGTTNELISRLCS